MSMSSTFFFFFFFLFFFSLNANSSNSYCDPTNKWDPQTLHHDKITVLINGFSSSRIPLLQSLAATYSLSPLVSSVLILWSNPSTPPRVLLQLDQNLTSLSTSSTPVTLHRNPTTSLNSRFLPHHRREIRTDAVLICDDDVELDHDSFNFAFRVWSTNRNRLVGVFSRSHDLDMNRKEWIYTVQPDRFSIILTKFMILDRNYLYKYSCEGGTKMAEMRGIVDSVMNCEDILMNFVVADEINLGPLMIGVNRVRDYGDSRNEDSVSGVGLSSRKGEHRKRRGWCIREFHRVLGRMPLRYSYGKIVDSVGEQGLCRKGGKLVFCDQ
ncbi:PREDICTED: glycosyltransferase family protein 64 C3 [Lupinus angustifolius]|uniref:glycosyltransferase family protein 64 C3 n=1 Tax=Lupinus angustifolius TaxID=3871 RepID=UPI00092E61EC|nr:PREDICTED: glycosyltransferase family protein 64 C3 [Lupinus angustifolius]